MATMGNNNHAMKKNILVFIPIVLLPFVILYIFDTRLWVAARDLIAPDYAYIPKLVTNWGLYLFYAIFAALFVYSFAKKNRSLTQICLAYIKAQLIVSFAVVRFLKIVLGRARPGHGNEFTFFSLNSRYNSLPSGHAADAFISGVFLYYLLRQSKYTTYRFLPLIYAFLIAVSRVFVSAHYPSDVAAGMVIGILGAWFFVSRRSNPDEPEKWPPRHKDTKQNCF
jgi:membrane-associated phospholipid phosphatase